MGIKIDISPRALHIHYAVSHPGSIVERHRRVLPSARTAIQQGRVKCSIRIEKGDYGFSIVAIEGVAVYGTLHAALLDRSLGRWEHRSEENNAEILSTNDI